MGREGTIQKKVLRELIVHLERHETRSVLFTIYTKKIQMDPRFLCERRSLKSFKRQYKETYLQSQGGEALTKTLTTKEKINKFNYSRIGNVCCSKGNHKDNEKISHNLGEDICNLYNRKRIGSQVYKNSHKSRAQKEREFYKK